MKGFKQLERQDQLVDKILGEIELEKYTTKKFGDKIYFRYVRILGLKGIKYLNMDKTQKKNENLRRDAYVNDVQKNLEGDQRL